MPAIFRLACDSCPYAVEGVTSAIWVIRDDGSEAICPHPLEFLFASEETGRPWDELERNGRLLHRSARVCLECGHLGYSSGPGATCSECRGRRLELLGGESGCLGGLLVALGLRRAKVHTCPKCRCGLLRRERTGET